MLTSVQDSKRTQARFQFWQKEITRSYITQCATKHECQAIQIALYPAENNDHAKFGIFLKPFYFNRQEKSVSELDLTISGNSNSEYLKYVASCAGIWLLFFIVIVNGHQLPFELFASQTSCHMANSS